MPVRNPFMTAQDAIPSVLCVDTQAYADAFACDSNDPDEIAEFEVLTFRSDEAAARLFWPLGDRGLAKRLHRIRSETLLVWGSEDRIISPDYAPLFAKGIARPTKSVLIAGVGHLAYVDKPVDVAAAVLDFLT